MHTESLLVLSILLSTVATFRKPGTYYDLTQRQPYKKVLSDRFKRQLPPLPAIPPILPSLPNLPLPSLPLPPAPAPLPLPGLPLPGLPLPGLPLPNLPLPGLPLPGLPLPGLPLPGLPLPGLPLPGLPGLPVPAAPGDVLGIPASNLPGAAVCLGMIPPPFSTLSYSMNDPFGPFNTGTLATVQCTYGIPSPGSIISATCDDGVWNPPTLTADCPAVPIIGRR